MNNKGKVFLIGAGPGDPGLITVRGKALLAQADVVIYDRLANPEFLDDTPQKTEKIFAGKQPDHHTLSQAEINDLLVQKAKEGLSVVRLKGGDPFVFGRGGEEAQALKKAGIPFEIVPGITSAIAAPAYAGIPVTHRGVAGSFVVITGHRRKEFDETEDGNGDVLGLDWESLAAIDTLIFLMGVGNLPIIARELVTSGRSKDTPVALIHRGTSPQQKVITGTLATIADKAEANNLRPPAAIIVGEVVNLRQEIQWFDNLPLFGKRVVVTRAKAQASVLSDQLRALGAEPIEFPTIDIKPPKDWQPLDQAIEKLGNYDWVIFTSVNGVRYFWERLERMGKDTRSLASAKIAAIGPATAGALHEKGILADLVPESYVSESLLDHMPQVKDRRILLPRANIARPKLAEGLRAAGAIVDEVAAYRTELGSQEKASRIKEAIENREIDVITFTSSSTVRNFIEIVGTLPSLPESITIACIGPITAQTARDNGFPVHVAANEYTIDGLVNALIDYFTR